MGIHCIEVPLLYSIRCREEIGMKVLVFFSRFALQFLKFVPGACDHFISALLLLRFDLFPHRALNARDQCETFAVFFLLLQFLDTGKDIGFLLDIDPHALCPVYIFAYFQNSPQ